MSEIKKIDEDSAKNFLADFFSIDNVLRALPWILIGAGALIIIDKGTDVGVKLAPLYDKIKVYNSSDLAESVDTVGDNMQFIDNIFKTFGIQIDNDLLKRISDFLQNIATATKWGAKLFDAVKTGVPKLQKVRSGSGSRRI
ncbi:MAG: hypothetical protein EU529_05885 [Promethearchaeota archaeon]|nr:MAG: hypothetical protein EU529_05885 [Candidatus Lokiarchaeota archaeon]